MFSWWDRLKDLPTTYQGNHVDVEIFRAHLLFNVGIGLKRTSLGVDLNGLEVYLVNQNVRNI